MSRAATPGASIALAASSPVPPAGGLLLLATRAAPRTGGFFQVSYLPYLSGLEDAGMDMFVAVHDATGEPAELNRPRFSLVLSPQDPRGVPWKPPRMDRPTAPSHDARDRCAHRGERPLPALRERGPRPLRTPRIFRARLGGGARSRSTSKPR